MSKHRILTREQSHAIIQRALVFLHEISPEQMPTPQMMAVASIKAAVEELGGWEAIFASHCTSAHDTCMLCEVVDIGLAMQRACATAYAMGGVGGFKVEDVTETVNEPDSPTAGPVIPPDVLARFMDELKGAGVPVDNYKVFRISPRHGDETTSHQG